LPVRVTARESAACAEHWRSFSWGYDYGDGTRSGAGLWRKFTHTWMKTADRWQIIGGMCAAQEPVKAPRV
jgi:hypothetical protein